MDSAMFGPPASKLDGAAEFRYAPGIAGMKSSEPSGQRPRGTGAIRSLAAALIVCLPLALVGGPARASAQAEPAPPHTGTTPPSAPDAGAATPEAVDPLSPRASLQAYLDACRAGRYAEAAVHLDPSGLAAGDEPSAAALRLKEVLDRHLWFDMSTVSPAAAGDLADGLPPDRERLGSIPTPGGEEDVLMVRRSGAAVPGWVFAPQTVGSIDGWYAGLGGGWLRSQVPPALLRPGPLELQWWQWLALPVAAALAWVLARLIGAALRPILAFLFARTRSTIDDLVLERLFAPAVYVLALGIFRAAVPFLDLTVPAAETVTQVLRALFLVGIFWVLTRLVDVAVLGLDRSAWMETRPEVRVLMPFVARAGRVVVLALGVVTVLQEFGFTVTGLLAGMGLAGMAMALAAQKSIENLLGSATILADKPFQPGDFVRVGDLVGTVEQVGLRSTRIRTLDRTLVTIPNGQLSDMRLETFAARDRVRLYCVLSLTYDTTSERLAKVIGDLEQVLRSHPRIYEDPIRVRFVEFGESSLNLEVFAYLNTSDWGEFLGLRQEIFLRFMQVVEENGCSFAFPTRTLHMEPAEASRRAEPRQPMPPAAAP
jgi:MscS family membrane protein